MLEKTKQRILYALIALTTVPFFFAVDARAGNSLIEFAVYGSAVLGYIGVSILLWQYILGTRTVIGLYFDDLSWVIKQHSMFGKLGSVLIFLHPLLILYTYGESWFYLINLDFSSEFNKHVTFGRLALVSVLIVWVTSALVRGKIAYRPWKRIHYLAYLALPFSFLHAPEIGSSYSNTAIQVYWYSFIAIFIILVVLRIRFFFGYGKQQYKIIEQKEVKQNVRLLELKSLAKPIDAKLGQYIYLQHGLLGEEHPFSVLKIDQQSGRIWVAYKMFGKFTDKLAKLKPGDTLNIDGPYGVFTSEINSPKDAQAVFIAGGIGVTPFVGYLIDKQYRENKFLFYANLSEETAIFRESLKKSLKDKYVDVFSENKKTAQNQEAGYITVDIIQKYIEDITQRDYYICGPPAMMDSIKTGLLEAGVPEGNLHLEEFSF